MDIIKNRKIFIAISLVLIVLGFAFMGINKSKGNGFFNYDIQFTGGTSISGSLGQDFNNDEVAEVIKNAIDVSNPQIQKVGSDNSISIKVRELTEEERTAVITALCEKYSVEKNNFEVETVGATISGEMKKSSILAVTISCLAMLIYVTLRFKDFRTGASCIIALVHDALIVLCCYAVFRIPLNNSFIAAILTVLGYSINASIIIFDRIRENKRKFSGKDNATLVNTSVMQTVRRSLFTSMTTFFTIASLYIFGVPSVKEFALPIVVGIICGTYSSIFIAGSVWYILMDTKKKTA